MNVILTESQIGELSKILINEDEPASFRFGPIPLGDNFEYGQYQSVKVSQKIDLLKPKIDEFLKKGVDNSFVLTIYAGESQVTNPPEFKVRGSLALARANEVKKYFTQKFSEMIKSGVLSIKSPLQVKEITIGATPYKMGDQNNPKLIPLYKKEQFVNFVIDGISRKKPGYSQISNMDNPIYMNNFLLGYVEYPTRNSKTSSDPGIKNTAYENIIFSMVKKDTVPPVVTARYYIPSSWWNGGRSGTTTTITPEDLKYIQQHFTQNG